MIENPVGSNDFTTHCEWQSSIHCHQSQRVPIVLFNACISGQAAHFRDHSSISTNLVEPRGYGALQNQIPSRVPMRWFGGCQGERRRSRKALVSKGNRLSVWFVDVCRNVARGFDNLTSKPSAYLGGRPAGKGVSRE